MCTNYYYDDGILCNNSNNLAADTMKMDKLILLPTAIVLIQVEVAPSLEIWGRGIIKSLFKLIGERTKI